MDMRKIGPLEVTEVGLGCNNFGNRCDEQQTAKVVFAALDAGVNFFDTADVYSAGASEQFLGKALGKERDNVIIASKFGHRTSATEGVKPGSAAWVRTALEASLRRLGTDRIDLYQMHEPDPDVSIDDTLGALNECVKEGKVLHIGNSNFDAAQIDEAASVSLSSGFPNFVSAQNHFSMLERSVQPDVLAACERNNLAMLPYFPLASGVLTGKYADADAPSKEYRLGQVPEERRGRFLNDENLAKVRKWTKFAEVHGHTMVELAIAWLLAQPTVASVIAGATRPEQVKANALGSGWVLTKAELEELDDEES